MDQQNGPASQRGGATMGQPAGSSAATWLQNVASTLNLKFLFLAHFSFAAWIMVGGYGGVGYMFHSIVLLGLLLYSMHCKENIEAVFLTTFVNGSALLLDLNLLIFHTRYFTLALLVLILHAIFRVVAILVLLNEHRIRGGLDFRTALSGVVVDRPSAYDDIDRTPHIPVPRSTTDYGNNPHMGGR